MKVIVSACLLGRRCKYDGGHNKNSAVLRFLEGKEVLPVCPESLVMPPPRPPAEIREGRVITKAGEDRTALFTEGVRRTLALIEGEKPDLGALHAARKRSTTAHSPAPAFPARVSSRRRFSPGASPSSTRKSWKRNKSRKRPTRNVGLLSYGFRMPEHAIYILEKFRAPFYHKGRKLYGTKEAVMKKYILLFLSFFLSLTISACAAQDSPIPAPAETARTESGENVREKGEALMRIPITANGRTWQAELEDSPAARALAAKMPLTLSLRDLYGRETGLF